MSEENASDTVESDSETIQQPGVTDLTSETAQEEASSSLIPVDGFRPFDHTNRKVVVFNVNKHMKPREIDALVETWKQALLKADIRIDRIKKPLSGCLYVTLESESMVEGMVQLLNSGQFTNKKGGLLSAKRADDRRERGVKFQRNEEEEQDNGNVSKKPRIADGNEFVKTDDEVRDALAPLWRLSYDQQLDQKARRMVNKCLVKIISETKAKFSHNKKGHGGDSIVYDWLKGKKIPMENILGAPLHLKYRNKCEFNFVSLFFYFYTHM